LGKRWIGSGLIMATSGNGLGDLEGILALGGADDVEGVSSLKNAGVPKLS
jgi:hypothetical protein